MKLSEILSNARGIAMVQVMVAASVVVGISAYVISSQMNQEKLAKTVSNKIEQHVLERELTEALTIPESCTLTLSQNGELAPDLNLNVIMHPGGGNMYQVGRAYYGKKIISMTLKGYEPSSDFKLSNVHLEILVDKEGKAGASQTLKTSYGSNEYTTKFRIPIFLISTPENNVRICGSNSHGTLESHYLEACSNLGGEYNKAKGICEKLHGQHSQLIKYVREHMCSASGGGCQHPYALQHCSGVDVRGANWENWVVRGFNKDGSLACSCVSRSCPNPANFCVGTDLGTDHCSKICPVGTRSGSACSTTPTSTDCANWSSWVPEPSNTCMGLNVTQTRTCDDGRVETRNVDGTLNSGECCTLWSDWAPSEKNICEGMNVSQSRTCKDGAHTAMDNRNIPGTKNDASCCSKWSQWEPSDLSTTCSTSFVSQMRSCIDGKVTRIDSRTVAGIKKDASCCSSWSEWAPSDLSQTCSNQKITQTKTCTDGGNTATESRQVSGQKNDSKCSCLVAGIQTGENSELLGWDGCDCEFKSKLGSGSEKKPNSQCCSGTESRHPADPAYTAIGWDDTNPPPCGKAKKVGNDPGTCAESTIGKQMNYIYKCN